MKKLSGFAILAVCLLTASSALQAQAPTMSVKITSPLPGAHFDSCTDILVTTDPQIEGGEIRYVTLYRNNVSVSSKAKAPFEITFKNYPPGYYVLTAKLTAKTGETVFSDPVPITVGNADKGNILMNGEFDCGVIPWNLSYSNGANANWSIDPTAEIASGAAATVNIVTGGSANWHVQFQQPFAIDSGHTYIMSFTAQSTENSKTIDVSIQQSVDPWTVYFQTSPTIESLQDYGPFVFECLNTDPGAYIKWNVGNTPNTTFWLDNVKVIDESLTGVRERKQPTADGVPTKQMLSRNYPNPFNPRTTIWYRVPEEADVTLMLFNLKGQAIRTLVRQQQNPGEQAAVWNGEDETGARVPSGVYVYQLKARAADRTYTLSRKIMLLE